VGWLSLPIRFNERGGVTPHLLRSRDDVATIAFPLTGHPGSGLARFDLQGNALWSAMLPRVRINALELSLDGQTVFAVGEEEDGMGRSWGIVVALDSQGSVRFVHKTDSLGVRTRLTDVYQRHGALYAAGVCNGRCVSDSDTTTEFAVMALRLDDAHVRWAHAIRLERADLGLEPRLVVRDEGVSVAFRFRDAITLGTQRFMRAHPAPRCSVSTTLGSFSVSGEPQDFRAVVATLKADTGELQGGAWSLPSPSSTLSVLGANDEGRLILGGAFRQELHGFDRRLRGRRYEGFDREGRLCPAGQSHNGFVSVLGAANRVQWAHATDGYVDRAEALGTGVVALERSIEPWFDGRGGMLNRLAWRQRLIRFDSRGRLTWSRKMEAGRLLDISAHGERELHVLAIEPASGMLQMIMYRPTH
jgi:hypothetical protein